MCWNYRVIRHDDPPTPWYGLHEVYYNEDGSVRAWAPKPDAIGDSLKDLRDGIAAMWDAAARHSEQKRCAVPVLMERDLPGYEAARAAGQPGEA